MKIDSIHIENFRSFKDETIHFDDYTCLAGPNGGGKSTVLSALNVFFRDTENASTDVVNLSIEDFHHKDTSKPIKITLTFSGLSKNAKEDFKDYFRHGKLVVSAVAEYDSTLAHAEVKQYGQRMGMSDFRPFFEASGSGKQVAELKELYKQLRESFTDLPSETTKAAMNDALRSYEESRPESCVLIPSGDEFYGFSRGVNRLERCVQWVFVPAVKDVTVEQNEEKTTALGKILARTVRQTTNFDEAINDIQKKTEVEYGELLKESQGTLKNLEDQLKEELKVWAHPDVSVTLSWQGDPKKSIKIEAPTARTKVGEGGFEGDLVRLGHGFQRSYLLALLQVLANSGGNEDAPTLLLGCEEPELYQHPPQARHLSSVLEKLSSQNAQVFVTTHHPAFVTGQGFENVRVIRFCPSSKESKQSQLTFEVVASHIESVSGTKPIKPSGVLAQLHQELQPALSEIFFTRNLVLVEGLEDSAIITSWMILTDRWTDFRHKGIHIVPTNGKSRLIYPLVIAQKMNIPVFTVFDADGQDRKHSKAHEKDNKILLRLLGADSSTPFPSDILWGSDYAVWPLNITEIIKKEIPTDKLARYQEEADTLYGHIGGLQKNSLHIASKLQQAFNDGIKPPSLETLCNSILAAAQN